MKKNKLNNLNRREFFAAGGGLLYLMSSNFNRKAESILGHSKRNRGIVPSTAKSKVVLVRTNDRAEGVKKCLELLKINPCSGKDVLIKPNFNTSDAFPGSTHNDTLRAVLSHVQEMGAKKVTIGDRSGPEPTDQVLEKKGIHGIAGEYDASVINFDALGESGYVKVSPPGTHWADGFLVAKPLVNSECIISTCCLKTHQYGGIFTMSLKNSVGIVPRENYGYMRELHSSPHQRKMIAEINAAYSPALIILDGIEAFVDGGPMTGERKTADVFLAGTDRIAVDAVGVAVLKELGSNDNIMGKKIFEQEQISRAAEIKLGAASPSEILIETGDAASREYAEKLLKILNA